MREKIPESQSPASVIVILGPTATGKTALATRLAHRLDGEIISADSRQVYCGMDLGTGKDLSEYQLGEHSIPYHLIDIVQAGEAYNFFRFQKDADRAYAQILSRGRQPILCGGSGMYLQAFLGDKTLVEVEENPVLREGLASKTQEELVEILASYRSLHNETDCLERERTLRAIEIADFEARHPQPKRQAPPARIFGIHFSPEELRARIRIRLLQRMEAGMMDEVDRLLHRPGMTPEKLIYYGLEYKYLTLCLCGKMGQEEMLETLCREIAQFAKRQRTWFRRMEKQGYPIHWIDGHLSLEEKVEEVLQNLASSPNS